MSHRLWIAGLLIAILVAGCRPTASPTAESTPPADPVGNVTPEPGTLDLTATVLANSDLSTLGSALVAAGLAAELEGEAEYTLLAPTDAAFAALPEGMLEGLFNDPASLAELLRYHLLLDATESAELTQLGSALTLQGEAVTITLSSDVIPLVNEAGVVEPDLAAANGIIHKIDRVLVPSTLAAQLQPAATAVAASPLTTTDEILLPTTTPESGAGTATETLTGTEPLTGAEALTGTEVVTTSEAMTPAEPVTGTETLTVSPPISVPVTNAEGQTITDLLAARPDLSSISAAVATAGLAEALTEPGPYTFFAPSDSAFARVQPAELETLLNDNVRLARTMQYHVIADLVTVEDLLRLGTALTTMGQSINMTTAADGRALANGAPILESIATSNGIVHVLDGILVPADQ